MIVVHGATGAQGSAVIAALSRRGVEAVGLSRQGNTGTPAVDLADPKTLIPHYANADAVFAHLPIPTGPSDPERLGGGLVEAVVRSGVQRVVFSTSGASTSNAGPHPALEARRHGLANLVHALAEGGAEVAVLEPRLFLENLLLPPTLEAASDGRLTYPLPSEARVSWTSHRDVGEAAAAFLVGDAPPGTYPLGDTPLDGDALADTIGSALNLELGYEAVPPAAFAAALEPLLGPAAAAAVRAHYEIAALDSELAIPREDSRRAWATIGVEPEGVVGWAHRMAPAFKGAPGLVPGRSAESRAVDVSTG